MNSNPHAEGKNEGLPRHRTDIQVMRGISVLAVLLFHARESWFTAGYLGVDAFFVVSGFVVTPLISRIFFEKEDQMFGESIKALRTFYLRRFYRLAPALGITLLFSFVLIFLLGPISDHARFAGQGIATLLLLGNWGAYHFYGNYFTPNPNPLIHLWSLSAEEQIYLILPVVIFLLLYVLRLKRKNSFLWIILVLGVFAFAVDATLRFFPNFLHGFGVSDVTSLLFYSPISRLWEFCIGGTAYLLSVRSIKIRSWSRNYLGFILTIALLGLLFLPINGYRFQSVIISLLAATALFFYTLDVLPHIIHQGFHWLGDRSYSIYLVHMPLIYAALYSPMFAAHRSLATIFAFILSITVGAIIYSQAEEHFRMKSPAPLVPPAQFRRLLLCFILIPILLFGSMYMGALKRYWGLDPNPKQPVYASTVDYSCYVSLTPCAYPVSKPKGEALLIGDSHAASLFQTFAEAMTAESVTAYVWQKNGCQFIPRENTSGKIAGLLGYGHTPDVQTCFDHNEAIMNWLKLHPKAFVFVSQRSSSIRPVTISEVEYRKLVFDNLVFLKTLSAELTVVGPNPEFPDVTQFFRGGLLIWQKAYVPPKFFPISAMIAQPAIDNKFLAAHLPLNNIHYIDSMTPFCTLQTCTRWSEAKWLFGDADHLSIYGAERLKPLIREQIVLGLK